jgi:hypothetical protein
MRPNPTTCYQLAMDSVAYIPAPKRHRTRTTILTTIPTLAVIALAAIASILAPTACQPHPPPPAAWHPTSATVATDMQRCTSGWQCHAEWNGDRAGWDVTATAPMPACATEDSTGPCHWDATTRGNHTGRSFTRTSDGTTVYQ